MKSLVVILTLGLVSPVFAHHSATMFKMAEPVSVTGVVKRFEWTNPHAYIYLEVNGPGGKPVEWTIELMSLDHLKAFGWSRKTVKAGDTITCIGGPARSGAPAMQSTQIKLDDGRTIRS